MDANDALEILYATPDPKEEILDVGKRDLPSELRERYWIEQGEEAGVDKRLLYSTGDPTERGL